MLLSVVLPLLFTGAESTSLNLQHSLLLLVIDNECSYLKYMQTTATELATAYCLLSYIGSECFHYDYYLFNKHLSGTEQITHFNSHALNLHTRCCLIQIRCSFMERVSCNLSSSTWKGYCSPTRKTIRCPWSTFQLSCFSS